MKKKTEELVPLGDNEVGIGYATSRALRQFCYAEDGRGILHFVHVAAGHFTATDGHALVRIPYDKNGAHRWLIHRDKLLAVRTAKDRMVLDVATGDLRVDGFGPLYPIRLPDAQADGAPMTYPDVDSVIAAMAKKPKVATIGLNAELANRAIALQKSAGGRLVIEVPENGPDGHVTSGIPFRITGTGISGAIMPMRVVD